ncbi:MAG: TolC family protein [Planctomycetales bacterium]|nr:TolC family protein [Planctomycetales bacterium]
MRPSKYRRKFGFLLALLAGTGCSTSKNFHFTQTWDCEPSYNTGVATQIEYPNVQSCLDSEVVATPKPFTLENPNDLQTRDISLDEVIQMALGSGEVLRTLGGSVVTAPAGTRTMLDPAISESNPQSSVEAALSAFDAQVVSQLYWQKNNRPNNIAVNPILSQFQVFSTQEDAAVFNFDISKRTATGARFAARHVINYSYPNTPNRLFPSSFIGWFEAEYRQPLLKGAGVEYNRIAGPNGGVGQYGGVLIARINQDISLADFELGIINYINDLESAYWELFYSYHNLESIVIGRDGALRTWQRVKDFERVGFTGGDAASVAEAQASFYQFDVNLKEALTGTNGLYAAEQRLRYLMGLAPTDGELLKPISQPMEGEIVFDWDSAIHDAVTKRVEIRRQKWNIKRRELEMIAARMNLRPTLDFLGLYRWRGMGDHMFGSRNSVNEFETVYQSILEGNYQEWQAGWEFSLPVGLRQASAGVTNARWNLAKEQALLKEQELRISHDLSTATREIARAFALVQSNYNRYSSDMQRVEARRIRVDKGLDNISFLVQAQQQLAGSRSAYYRSLTDYQLAIRNFHREKGSLLNYNLVNLSEGPWVGAAYQDGTERGRFFAPRSNPSAVEIPHPVSSGAFDPSQVGDQVITNYEISD